MWAPWLLNSTAPPAATVAAAARPEPPSHGPASPSTLLSLCVPGAAPSAPRSRPDAPRPASLRQMSSPPLRLQKRARDHRWRGADSGVGCGSDSLGGGLLCGGAEGAMTVLPFGRWPGQTLHPWSPSLVSSQRSPVSGSTVCSPLLAQAACSPCPLEHLLSRPLFLFTGKSPKSRFHVSLSQSLSTPSQRIWLCFDQIICHRCSFLYFNG